MPRRLVARLLLFCLVVSMTVPSQAAFWDAISDFQKPNMHLGPAEIHPYYQFSELYDDNIYLVPDDKPGGVFVGGGKRGSWIHDNDAGLRATLPISPSNKLDLGYDGDYKAYTQQPSANNAFSQKADGSYAYRGEAVRAGVADTYINTVDPAFSELIQRTHRWQNTGSANAEYGAPGGAGFVGIDGFQKTDKYLDPALAAVLNRYEDQAGVKVGYWVQPQTRAYAAYHRDIIHFTAGRADNNKSHLADVGVEGTIAPKLSGQIQTGFGYRHYDFTAALPSSRRDVRYWEIASKVVYKPLERTTGVLEVSRNLQESTFLPNRYYYSTSATAGLEHKFPSKFSAGASLSFGVDQYPEGVTIGTQTKNRRDNLYTQEVHLRYDIQEWLYTGVSFMHRNRVSNFSDTFNYDDDVTSLSLGVRL